MKLICLKRISLIYLLLLALPSISFASWQPYIGFNIGLSKSQNTFTGYLTNNLGAGNTTINMDTTGTSESLLLGIRHQQTNFFYAFEAFTSVHQFTNKRKGNEIFRRFNPNIMTIIGTYDFEVTQKYTEGLSCLIGKDLTTNLDVFFKLDVLWSQFLIKYTNADRPSSQGQGSKWLFGFAPGVGLQYNLTQSLATRLDYSYRIYNEFKSKNIANDSLFANTNVSGRIAPRIHQFTLSLIYKF